MALMGRQRPMHSEYLLISASAPREGENVEQAGRWQR